MNHFSTQHHESKLNLPDEACNDIVLFIKTFVMDTTNSHHLVWQILVLNPAQKSVMAGLRVVKTEYRRPDWRMLAQDKTAQRAVTSYPTQTSDYPLIEG